MKKLDPLSAMFLKQKKTKTEKIDYIVIQLKYFLQTDTLK